MAGDSEGTVHGFTAASAQVLWEAFPIYDYDDLSDLTSLPDGTYRFTWEGTAQTVTINYQAYSKWFAYIANQIAYNRNWLDKRLDQLSFSTGDITMSPTDLTPAITSIDAVGVNIEDLNANFNTSLGSLVDKLDVIVDKSSESVENLTVEISVDNDAHNVFYVTDEDGNEESLVDFSGDVLKAGGKLLNFLFKVCFDGAIDNLDGSIDDMDSFYFDGAELGGSLWE